MNFRCITAPIPNLSKWVFEKLVEPREPRPVKPVVEAEVRQFILSDSAPTPASGHEVVFVCEVKGKDGKLTTLWMEYRLNLEE